MLFKLIRDGEETAVQAYEERPASKLNLTEKNLENWMARNPDLLFGAEKVLVIGQSVAGKRMGDILALDADGHLVIVEIKRDWSDRATVGQLLEYAAEMTGKSYKDLEKMDREYWPRRHGESPYIPLIERIRELTDDPEFDQNDIPKGHRGHRIIIVAPASDEGLLTIVDWLQEYGVPINFVPFTLHADSNDAEVLLEIEPLPKIQLQQADVSAEEWKGDWIFNTNETYAPNAYQKMFDQGVIAIHGYETGATNLTGSAKDQRVFAYVNKKGVLAVGRIVDGQVISGTTVFGQEREYHVKVVWETIVSDDNGVRIRDVRKETGYNLPVRCVFAGMNRHDAADWIADELKRRSDER